MKYTGFVWSLVMSWWRHQMEPFSPSLVLYAGNSPVDSTHKGQWRGALTFPLICAWTNDKVNNRDTGDLIRRRAHYGVNVMFWLYHYYKFFVHGCNLHIGLHDIKQLLEPVLTYNQWQYEKVAKMFTGPAYTLLLSFTVISDVYTSFITKILHLLSTVLLNAGISKLPGSFEIYWVRQDMVNFTGLVGIVNTTVYKPKPIFRCLSHGKSS